MDEPTQHPMETLFARLADTLGELAPEPLLARMRPVLEGFFEQFQLVPKREYDAHMATLRRLEETVIELEARVSGLEQDS